MRVVSLLVGAVIEQILDHRFVAVCGGAMQRHLAFCSHVADKRSGFFAWNRLRIYVCSVLDEKFYDV